MSAYHLYRKPGDNWKKKVESAKGGLVQSHPQVLSHFQCPEARSKVAFFKDFPMNYDFRLQGRAELAERYIAQNAYCSRDIYLQF